jgi:hypothetical protein
MHESVNDRLRAALEMLQMQSQQFRTFIAVLTQRLGTEQIITPADIKSMQDAGSALLMTAKPGVLAGPDGQPQQEELHLKVISGEEAKALAAQQPRIVNPADSGLVIAPH